MIAPLAWALAALCVVAMGYAIQRGGTCTVAAVDELVTQRRARRMAAMLEASLWVAGGLALASLLHLAGSMPAGYEPDRWTVAGGALLGLGAWLNRACVFGAIARLGSGEWAYAATPLGYYAGCLSAAPLFARGSAAQAAPAPLLAAAAWLAAPFVAYALWRLLRPLRAGGWHGIAARVWAPHAATIVIGITFLASWLLAGRWAYTDVLADLAHGMASSLGGRMLLLAALYAGALLGGWTAGRWRAVAPLPGRVARSFAGGMLMGWGSLLIPGSNDGLILIGLPLLRPYAWIGFATMCAAIAAALLAERAWAARRAGVAA